MRYSTTATLAISIEIIVSLLDIAAFFILKIVSIEIYVKCAIFGLMEIILQWEEYFIITDRAKGLKRVSTDYIKG